MNERIKDEIRIQTLEKLGAEDWEIKGLLWSDIIINKSNTPITESAFNAKLAELIAEYDAQEYARNRKTEYDVLNQLEMQFDDEVNSTTTWKDAILAIKAKYPKPE